MKIYEPEDDSYFLAEVTKNYLLKHKLDVKKIKVLDVGTGSGIQSKNCIDLGVKKENILAVDINPLALENVKKQLKIKTVKSNLFVKVKGKYDLILFNPPYLPEDEYDNLPDTSGGKNGDETIIRFIKNFRRHLSNNGICLLLTSSFTPKKRWKVEAKKQKTKIKKLAEKKIFYEKLFVWEVKIAGK